MLLTSWPLQDFAGFLQIVSWIMLPILAIALVGTYLHHHYYSKKNRNTDDRDAATPRKFRENEPLNQVRYRALRRDFETLQRTYDLNVEELAQLQMEIKRQDMVIERLREDLSQLERKLDAGRTPLLT